MPAGRPSTYTDELAAKILGRIANGESLRSICEYDDMPARSTVFKWVFEKKEFSDQYDKARAMQAEGMADEILDISDDGTNDWMERRNDDGEITGYQVNGEAIQRSRLRVDARKWVASRLLPKKYGDKLAVGGDPDAPPIQTENVSSRELAIAMAKLIAKGNTDAD